MDVTRDASLPEAVEQATGLLEGLLELYQVGVAERHLGSERAHSDRPEGRISPPLPGEERVRARANKPGRAADEAANLLARTASHLRRLGGPNR